jgi:type III pantothenate kinase
MLGLMIGNSRYHWAWFHNSQLQGSWDTPYLSAEKIAALLSGVSISDFFPLLAKNFPTDLSSPEIDNSPIYLASVVPAQTEIWLKYPQVRPIGLGDLPLANLYSNLGIDRALAVLGAGRVYGNPVLVIDGGTALTFTGVDGSQNLVGGAIIPGLKLQLRSLDLGTAALSPLDLPAALPSRWSRDTQGAIASGVLYTTIAGIYDFMSDWWRQFPDSHTIFTGGDGETIFRYLSDRVHTSQRHYLNYDRDVLFKGIELIIQR